MSSTNCWCEVLFVCVLGANAESVGPLSPNRAIQVLQTGELHEVFSDGSSDRIVATQGYDGDYAYDYYAYIDRDDYATHPTLGSSSFTPSCASCCEVENYDNGDDYSLGAAGSATAIEVPGVGKWNAPAPCMSFLRVCYPDWKEGSTWPKELTTWKGNEAAFDYCCQQGGYDKALCGGLANETFESKLELPFPEGANETFCSTLLNLANSHRANKKDKKETRAALLSTSTIVMERVTNQIQRIRDQLPLPYEAATLAASVAASAVASVHHRSDIVQYSKDVALLSSLSFISRTLSVCTEGLKIGLRAAERAGAHEAGHALTAAARTLIDGLVTKISKVPKTDWVNNFYTYVNRNDLAQIFKGSSMKKTAKAVSQTEGEYTLKYSSHVVDQGSGAAALEAKWAQIYKDDVITLYHGTDAETAETIIREGFIPNKGGKSDGYGLGECVYMTNSVYHANGYGNTVLELKVYGASSLAKATESVYGAYRPSMIFPKKVFTDVVTETADGSPIHRLQRGKPFKFND